MKVCPAPLVKLAAPCCLQAFTDVLTSLTVVKSKPDLTISDLNNAHQQYIGLEQVGARDSSALSSVRARLPICTMDLSNQTCAIDEIHYLRS